MPVDKLTKWQWLGDDDDADADDAFEAPLFAAENAYCSCKKYAIVESPIFRYPLLFIKIYIYAF